VCVSGSPGLSCFPIPIRMLPRDAILATCRRRAAGSQAAAEIPADTACRRLELAAATGLFCVGLAARHAPGAHPRHRSQGRDRRDHPDRQHRWSRRSPGGSPAWYAAHQTVHPNPSGSGASGSGNDGTEFPRVSAEDRWWAGSRGTVPPRCCSPRDVRPRAWPHRLSSAAHLSLQRLICAVGLPVPPHGFSQPGPAGLVRQAAGQGTQQLAGQMTCGRVHGLTGTARIWPPVRVSAWLMACWTSARMASAASD
jgi:hypothetical protein